MSAVACDVLVVGLGPAGGAAAAAAAKRGRSRSCAAARKGAARNDAVQRCGWIAFPEYFAEAATCVAPL